MKKIGLTGGIGSGKSIISKVFSSLGIPVFIADDAAKEVVHTDPAVKEKIIELLGPESFNGNTYNRSYVASKVFQDRELLQNLNHIIHPATYQAFQNWLARQDAPYIIKEASIIFESGSYKKLDKVITVNAPVDVRIQRVINRDNSNSEHIRSRMLSQMTDEQRVAVSDFVITNDDLEPVLPQVLRIHNILIH